jgi:hypothetical protein
VKSLQSTLCLILDRFNDAFIVLDSLDECAERKELLKWIKEMTSWKHGKLHLLATSRLEEDIAKQLRQLEPLRVCLKPELVTPDIEKYVNSIIQTEEAFKRWNERDKANIRNKLLGRADGMYACFIT